MKRTCRLSIVCGLVLLDVSIKIFITYFWMDKKFYITDKLGFIPKLNTTQLSAYNRELGLNIGIDKLFIINILHGMMLKRPEKRVKNI